MTELNEILAESARRLAARFNVKLMPQSENEGSQANADQ
jgi:hypothetical protein